MKYLRSVLVIVGGAAGCAIAAGITGVGCSSGSGGGGPQPEAGADVTTDAQPDIVTSDVVKDVQTQDVVDSGTADVDSAASIPPFLTQVATAFCSKVGQCCANQMPSGKTFDQNGCVAVNTGVGYQGTALGAGPLLAGGTLKYDPNKAAACLSDINAIDCNANVITTQQQLQILQDCTAAVYGTFAAGTACVETIECASGLFCDTPADGGSTGTCAPLRGDGGACGDFGDIPSQVDYGLSEEACSYRRTGNTQLRCDNADPTTGNPYPGGPAVWTCKAAAAANGPCNLNQDCTTMLCDPGSPGYGYYGADGGLIAAGGSKFTCATSLPFAYPNACLPFAK